MTAFHPLQSFDTAIARRHMSLMDPEKQFVRPDGEQRVSVARREDGLWALGEETRFYEEPHPAIGDGYFYWAPTGAEVSLFDSFDVAIREAAARYEWVQEQLKS